MVVRYPTLVAALCLGLLGCPDRDIGPSGGGTEGSTSDDPSTDPSSTESATGIQMECDAEDLLCDGKCINPRQNDSHCGECNRPCKFTKGGVGDCVDGEYCTPGWSHCVEPWDDYANCHEACAAWGGETCVEEGRKIQHGFDAELGCDAYLNISGDGGQPDAKCSDPFDFSEKGIFDEPTIGIRCLCTQNNLDDPGDV